MVKTLILGTCYIAQAQEGAQNYGARLVKLWADVVTHLNPDTDVLLVDSHSPVSAIDASGFNMVQMLDTEGDPMTPGSLGYSSPSSGVAHCVALLPNNIGHLNVSGQDGWGRSFSAGVKRAIAYGYDYLAYMDSDIIFTQPVAPIIDKMHRAGVKAACPMDSTYGFLENGLMFLNVGYLRETDFVGRYDWKNRGASSDPMQIPERIFETLLDDVLFTLPLRGLRNDFDRLTVNNIDQFFPYGGPDYLTHCKDFALYDRLLERAGIKL